MRNFRGFALTFAGTFALVAALALASQSRVDGQVPPHPGPHVLVTNGPDAPVPVTGDVEVAGTVQAEQAGDWSVDVNSLPAVQQAGDWSVDVNSLPAVQQAGDWSVDVNSLPAVQQSGQWEVGINGTPTVSVGNTLANPIPVQQVSGGTPFSGMAAFTVPHGAVGGARTIDIPPGKALVIEHVSIRAQSLIGQDWSALLLTEHAPATGFRRDFELGVVPFRSPIVERQRLIGNYDVHFFHVPVPGGFGLEVAVERQVGTSGGIFGDAPVAFTISGYLVDM